MVLYQAFQRAKNPGIQVVLANPANGVTTEVGNTSAAAESLAVQPTGRERHQDVEQINAEMQFEPNVQPPPYAASASSTYAYDQPLPTNDAPATNASPTNGEKPAVMWGELCAFMSKLEGEGTSTLVPLHRSPVTHNLHLFKADSLLS